MVIGFNEITDYNQYENCSLETMILRFINPAIIVYLSRIIEQNL